ncbi:MAG TPA: TetR family transcriptional regulator [Rhizomicrobium sp.]|nr:TetR family transcriptional regulator [Rhizomicrobium sp.]
MSSTRGKILEAARRIVGQGPLSMAKVADGAGLSRQAVYLHFPGRVALLAALAQGAAPDSRTSLDAVAAAPSARAALAGLVARQAATDPALWPMLADAAQAQTDRLAQCRAVAERFQAEGALSPQLSAQAATDLLWSLTSPRLWTELVRARGWSVERAQRHLAYLAAGALTR